MTCRTISFASSFCSSHSLFFHLYDITDDSHRRRQRCWSKKGICTSAWHLRVPINSVISCVNLTHQVRAPAYRMKVQNFVSIQFFASIYFAFHFALFVLFHSLLPLQQHRKNQNKKTIKFNSRYWVNVWLNVMLARTPSIEIKTRFGIKVRIQMPESLRFILFMLRKVFFFSHWCPGSWHRYRLFSEFERDPVEFIVFVGFGVVVVLSYRSFHSTILSAGSDTHREGEKIYVSNPENWCCRTE